MQFDNDIIYDYLKKLKNIARTYLSPYVSDATNEKRTPKKYRGETVYVPWDDAQCI